MRFVKAGICIAILAGAFTAHSQSRKIAVIGCYSDQAIIPGADCQKGHDGNQSTVWRAQAGVKTITLHFAVERRIKRVVANWATPAGTREYFCLDRNQNLHSLRTFSGTGTTDDFTLRWGDDALKDTVCNAKSVVIKASIASGEASLREATFYDAGVYYEETLHSRTIPIPAWNMNTSRILCLDLPAGISADRIVGISAVIRSDHGSVHALSRLNSVNMTINGEREPVNRGSGGGTLGVTEENPCNNNRWQIFLNVEGGNIFANMRAFTSLSTNPRGHVKIEYLKQAPSYQ